MQNLSSLALLVAAFTLAGCAQESAPSSAADDGDAPAAMPTGTDDAAAEAAPEVVAVTAGNAEAGQRIYIYCQSCHSINEGGPNKVGPNLYGIFGSPAAQVDGFVYSQALTDSGIVWTAETLNEWVAAPAKLVPGTTMLFAGVNDPQQRADLIAFLREKSAATQ